MRILVVGDTHGNMSWYSNYIIPLSTALKADKILVVGDFGYWEHDPSGVQFLDVLDGQLPIPLYWLHGNHDKWSLTMKLYGDSRDGEDFVRTREQILYIPQGHAWAWSGARLRSFGGAYSVDKNYRLRLEAQRFDKLARVAQTRARALGRPPSPVPPQSGTLWFPEEQMSNSEMDELLAADSERKDVIFSHDKPLKAEPRWNRKDLPPCIPNQERLQQALAVHRPTYWFHGHLHFGYTDTVQTQRDVTTVIGLAPDEAARESIWQREQSWATLDIAADGSITVSKGDDMEREELAELNKKIFTSHR